MKYRNTIIVVMAVALVACGGPEERKAKYRARGQQYIEAGNYPKARVALRNVLKIDPKDADAYYLFAQVEEKEKNWRNAVSLYQEVVQLVPDHTGALITLAKYYLEARLTEQVVSTADKVLAKDPQHPQANALKIAVLAVEGKRPDAMIKAEALRSQFPTEPDVAILLATLYGQQQRYGDAEATLRLALEAHPRDMDLLNNLTTILLQANDMAGAETVARRMIEAEPTLFDHRLRLARLFNTQGAPEKAEAVLRDAIVLEPNSEERRLLLADFLTTRKNHPAAEQALLEAATQLPHSTMIQFGLATLYQTSGEDTKAREQYASLVKGYKEKPAGLEAKVKLAEMDLVSGKQAEAERQVQEVLKENPRSSDGLILSGRMALSRRNGKDAVQAFRTVLHDQPELATVHFLLGQAYLMTGESNLAKESFERAVALYPGQVDARRSLAALESQSGRHQEARARLDDLLKQRPDDLAALEMLFNLDLVTRNWVEAERTLNRLRAVSKDSVVAVMAEGRLRQAQGQLDKASAAYERATVLAPNDPEPLLSLVKLDVALGHADRAWTRLVAVLAAQPDHLFGHGLLGEVLVLTSHPQEADAQFREASRLNPKWITPWLDWGGLWLAQKQPDQAVQVIQAGLNANPDSGELHMLLASAHSAQGQIDHAITAYDGALRLNPRNVLAANNLAVLLVDYKGDPQNLQKAFALSRDFEKDAPHPLFLDTLGWVRFKMGQQEEAFRLMKDAVAKLPEVPTLNYHLGMAYYQSGKTVEARAYLSKALKTAEAFPGRQEAEQVLAQMRG
ncbi:MAG: tetratricopeptide repeat protein [Nitrospirae bacterium]|nr:tetratricopeptide repeat protein [Nitrospirota bacterium]MDE3042034.1 tetratricopeptide repeat protein [Nitrospirota bacterium]